MRVGGQGQDRCPPGGGQLGKSSNVSDGHLIVSVRMVVIPVQSPKTLHLCSILKTRKQSRLLAQNLELKSRVRLDVPVAVQA